MRKILLALFIAMGTQGVAAEDAAKPAEWLFVHTAQTAEMTSDTTLVMPVTRDIFAFTDRPNRQHGYMKAHQFVTLWDEGEGDTFKADPPNAVLTWVDGDEMKEAEVLITNAKVVGDGYGTAVQYSVKLEDGDTPLGNMGSASFFIDGDMLSELSRPKDAAQYPAWFAVRRAAVKKVYANQARCTAALNANVFASGC